MDARPGKVFHGKVSADPPQRHHDPERRHLHRGRLHHEPGDADQDAGTTVYDPVRPRRTVHDQELELLPYLTANLTFHVAERENALLVPNAALRWRPQLDQVAPEYRDEYEESLHKKADASDAGRLGAGRRLRLRRQAGEAGEGPGGSRRGQEADGGRGGQPRHGLGAGRPVRPADQAETGLTDGVMTEVVDVVKVHDGDALDEGTELVTGENAGPRRARRHDEPVPPPPIFRPQQPKKQDDQ